ncbi:Aldo/keto reductase [Lipomyces doorenjongii]|uniref:Aldo/keto reductase n=1 Tax=Lipomyces doorenjongii TaxID=383834 RepID=UPI0034CD0229
MSPNGVKIIYGAAAVALKSMETLQETFSVLEKHDVKDLDTAYIYTKSEETLNKAGAPARFIIHSKAPCFEPGALSKENVLKGIDETLERLGVSNIETYFLHAPDPTTPIEETLSAIDEIYNAGKFKHFGLSNFKTSDVQKIYDIQSSKESVLPTVFQGNYNAVSRKIEKDLFPLLHKLKIAFYAYSPIAGGFLVKSPEALKAGTETGRFDVNGAFGPMYNGLYNKASLLEALAEWGTIASAAGISKAALAYRWIVFHSALTAANGDGIIIGASTTAQLEETLDALEDGPLEEEVVAKIEGIWSMVEKDAPLDNYHSYLAVGK